MGQTFFVGGGEGGEGEERKVKKNVWSQSPGFCALCQNVGRTNQLTAFEIIALCNVMYP